MPSMATIAFERQLARKGLINPNTGNELVKGINGEDGLLAKWREAAEVFIFRGQCVSVDMRVERTYFNESRCYPVICDR